MWRGYVREWFVGSADDAANARFPVTDVDGRLVATAIGALEIGVPNPQCVRGRTVRLAHVIALPEHRGSGYGTAVARHVIDWARPVAADRADLSALPTGMRIHTSWAFTMTSAP